MPEIIYNVLLWALVAVGVAFYLGAILGKFNGRRP